MRRRLRATLLAAAGLSFPAVAGAACSITPGTDGNGNSKLTIKGDAAAQRIFLLDSGDSVDVSLDCNNDGDFSDPGEHQIIATNFEVFEIAGGGKDTISLGADGPGARKSFAVILGPTTAGLPNWVNAGFIGLSANGSVTLDIQGSTGSDRITVQSGNLIDSSVVVRGDLGAGDDFLYVSASDLTNSTITNDVALGSGKNEFHDETSIELHNATYLTTVTGSDGGADRTTFLSDALVDDKTRIIHDVRLLGGNDSFTEHLARNLALQNGSELRVRANGGAGADSLVAETSTTAGFMLDVDASSALTSVLLGEDGNDRVVSNTGLDGSGFHRFFLSGGDGSDVLIGTVGADSIVATPNVDVVLEGGRGSDLLYLVVSDPAGNATYGPLATTLLSGGTFDALTDDCVVFGEAPFDFLDCERLFLP